MSDDAARPFAIVVVNYGSSALLQRMLVASARSVAPDLVVVVDNLTTLAERRAVRALAEAHGWSTVLPGGNLGFGAGANAGIAAARAAGARDLLLLNPDAAIGFDAVRELRATSERDRLAVLAPVIREPSGAIWSAGADLLIEDGSTRGLAPGERDAGPDRWGWLSGACLWIPAEAWELVGGFDEDYFLYWEDIDLCRRLVQRGGRISVVSAAEAVHDEGGTHRDPRQRGRAKSSVYYYYNIRNRMLFASKHLDAAGIARWRRSIPASALEVLLRGGRRQFLDSLRPLIAAWRGARDARRIAHDSLRRDLVPAE